MLANWNAQLTRILTPLAKRCDGQTESLFNTEHPDTGKGQARSEEKTATSSSDLTESRRSFSASTTKHRIDSRVRVECTRVAMRACNASVGKQEPRSQKDRSVVSNSVILLVSFYSTSFLQYLLIVKSETFGVRGGPCWIFSKNFKVFLKILTILCIRQLKNTHLTINTERRLLSESAGLV